MRIMGVDPGLRCTGYAVISAEGEARSVRTWGLIRTRPNEGEGARLLQIYRGLQKVMQHWAPELLVLEDCFLGRSAREALRLGQARAAALLAAASQGLRVMEVHPRTLKQAFTGSGSADKGRLRRALGHFLSMKEDPPSDHISDALALAVMGSLRL